MAKKIKAQLRMNLSGGGATPAPPVGSVLGQQGVNLMEFCKQFNAATADRRGQTVPVKVTVYQDKTFSFVVKTTSTSELIKKRAGVSKGVSEHSRSVGTLSMSDVEEIAKIKMPDLNVYDLESAKKVVVGSAISMGIQVSE